MIVQVRGSSCSGKTTAVTQLLSKYPPIEELWEPGWNKQSLKLAGYLLPGDLFLAGGYLPSTRTGGLDSFGSGRTDQIWAWLRWHCRRHRHVVFEGLMASLVIGRSRDLLTDLQAVNAPCLPLTFAFLDTPLNMVLARLLNRTGGLGPTQKGVNLKDTGQTSWKRVQKIRAAFLEEGLPLVDLHWRFAADQLDELLRNGGWDPNDPRGVSPVAPPAWWYEREMTEDATVSRKRERANADTRRRNGSTAVPTPAEPSLDDRLDRLLRG